MTTATLSAPVWLRRIAVALAILPFLAAEGPEKKAPSTYASAEEIANQVDAYVKEIQTDLGGESEYGDEQKQRVAKDANTLIVLGQVIGNHDQDHPLKKAAPGLIAASQKLASATDELDQAKAAFEEVKKSLTSASDEKVSWEPIAELSQLMKQVPIVNNKLRLGVTGRRFDRTIEQNVGLAVTLAAIAEASRYDTAYCSSKEEEGTWAKICDEMRNAAAEVRDATRKKDQATAKAGLEKLVKTCDDCHHSFRD